MACSRWGHGPYSPRVGDWVGGGGGLGLELGLGIGFGADLAALWGWVSLGLSLPPLSRSNVGFFIACGLCLEVVGAGLVALGGGSPH